MSFHLKSCIIAHRKEDGTGDTTSLERHRQERRKLSKNIFPLSYEEEILLLQTFRAKIADTCRLFRFPKETVTIAHWYMLRYYYLSQGGLPLQTPMKYIMLASCLLAAKHENQHPTKTSLTSSISLDFDLLQRVEIHLLSCLEHQISFKSLDFTMISLLFVMKITSENDKIKVFQKLYQIVQETNCLLLYSPLEISSIVLWISLGIEVKPQQQQPYPEDNFNLKQSSLLIISELEDYKSSNDEDNTSKIRDIKFIRELDQKLQANTTTTT